MSLVAVPRTWEYKEISLPRGTSREMTRQLLTGAAETGHWELAKSRIYPDGRRTVWLRRRVYRVSRTDLPPA